MSRKWDLHFIQRALLNAGMSKDPNTRVGAVIVDALRGDRSSGFNGFPRGVQDTTERLDNRDTKNLLMVHAEMNAILNAARVGIPLAGCTLYLAATDSLGEVWGGPPCVTCAIACIQAGITEIVAHPFKTSRSNWTTNIEISRKILAEAYITYREVPHHEH